MSGQTGPKVGAAPQEEEWLTGHAFQVPARPSKPGGAACRAHPHCPLPVPRFVFTSFHLAGSPLFIRWEGTVQRAEGPVRGRRPQPGGSGSPPRLLPHRHSCQQASTGPVLCAEGPWRTRTTTWRRLPGVLLTPEPGTRRRRQAPPSPRDVCLLRENRPAREAPGRSIFRKAEDRVSWAPSCQDEWGPGPHSLEQGWIWGSRQPLKPALGPPRQPLGTPSPLWPPGFLQYS